MRFDIRPGSYAAMIIPALLLVSVEAQAGTYPRDEIAFCPSGGPTGWMNYFDKRDRDKRWKRYWRYRHYQQAGYAQASYHYPVFNQPGRPAARYYSPQAAGAYSR